MDKIFFAKMKEGAILPSKREEDAGYDFYACFDEDVFVIKSHETKAVPTGIAWASSPKYYLQIEERSSLGVKGIKKNSGVIDSGYRGEILIPIFNSTEKTFVISKVDVEKLSTICPELTAENIILQPYKKAIAQGVLHIVPEVEVEEMSYDELSKIPSLRGDGRCGSSNK